MTRVVAVGFGAVLLAFGLGTLLGFRLGGRESQATTVVAHPVDPKPTVDDGPRTTPDGLTGVIIAREQVPLSAGFSARVVEIPVKLGDRLRKGDVVARLDAESIRREVATATAAVKAAQAEVQAARVEESDAVAKLRRLEGLGDAVSEEERETARARVRTAAARVAAARARVSEAVARVGELEQLLATSAVTATFDGVVAQVYVSPGTMVDPGRPIVRVISGDELWVRFAVPEAAAGSVTVNGCVNVAVPSLQMTTPGVIERVAPQIDSASGMLHVEAALSLPDTWKGKLPTGLAAVVTSVPCGTRP
jgi:RND family efflux transporter MFP subunit